MLWIGGGTIITILILALYMTRASADDTTIVDVHIEPVRGKPLIVRVDFSKEDVDWSSLQAAILPYLVDNAPQSDDGVRCTVSWAMQHMEHKQLDISPYAPYSVTSTVERKYSFIRREGGHWSLEDLAGPEGKHTSWAEGKDPRQILGILCLYMMDSYKLFKDMIEFDRLNQ